jgi:hypothetical protein
VINHEVCTDDFPLLGEPKTLYMFMRIEFGSCEEIEVNNVRNYEFWAFILMEKEVNMSVAILKEGN